MTTDANQTSLSLQPLKTSVNSSKLNSFIKRFRSRTLVMLCVFGLAGFSTHSAANTETAAENRSQSSSIADSEKPIQINANSLSSDEKNGISTYKGAVIVTQGSMTLKGDIVTINHPDGALTTLVATGIPANFKRFDQQANNWMTGQAQRIEYNAVDKVITLIGQAKAEQPGKHLITGPKLIYDMQSQTLQAQSTDNEKQRISVTLTPAKNQ